MALLSFDFTANGSIFDSAAMDLIVRRDRNMGSSNSASVKSDHGNGSAATQVKRNEFPDTSLADELVSAE